MGPMAETCRLLTFQGLDHKTPTGTIFCGFSLVLKGKDE
jgi:hypothetical protein